MRCAEMTELFLGPTYVAANVSDMVSGAMAVLLIVSHLPMIVAVCYAFMARHARLAVAGLASVVVSIAYHSCRADIACLGLPVNQLRLGDHTCVLWLVGALGLHLTLGMLAPPRSQLFFTVTGYLLFPVGFLAVLFLPFTLLSAVIMFIYVAFVATVRLALLPCEGDRCCAGPKPDSPEGRKLNGRMILYFIIGIAAAVVSLGCYFIPEGSVEGNTVAAGTAHCVWHILSGIALLALSAAVSQKTETILRTESRRVDLS